VLDKDDAVKASDVNPSWTEVINRNKAKQLKPTKSAQHRFLGKGSASATNRPSIKAVPRKLQAFVSRLDLNTTADDLVTWFGSVGIADVQCYKIDPSAGRKFTTAAFKVACDVSYQHCLCLPASHRMVQRDRYPSRNLKGIGGIRLTLCPIILRLTITCLVLI